MGGERRRVAVAALEGRGRDVPRDRLGEGLVGGRRECEHAVSGGEADAGAQVAAASLLLNRRCRCFVFLFVS